MSSARSGPNQSRPHELRYGAADGGPDRRSGSDKRVERGHALQRAGHGAHEGALGVVSCGDDAASRSGGLMQQHLVDVNHAERFRFKPDQVLRVTHAEFGVGHTLFYRSRTGNLNGF